MQIPTQVTIRDIPHSGAVEQHILNKAEKLNQYSRQIIGCQVVVEQTQKHKHQGKLHNVRINVSMPRHTDLCVTQKEAENLYIAIRDAFDSMVRKVENAAQIINGFVKHHPVMLRGTIVRIFDYGDFGFIEGADGNEYYFNSNNVAHPSFKKLKVGTDVHFFQGYGDDGLQARRVKTVKHHA